MYPAVKPKKDRDKPQFPDIFVYLVRGGHHIAYLRWTAHELLKMTKEEQTAPRWRSFVEEPCLDAFGPGEIPGSLLCNLQLGKEGELQYRAAKELLDSTSSPCQLRFHLYMAKFLPAKDENGLCDPYVVVKYHGKTMFSSVKGETCNPTYFETLICDVSVPDEHVLSPPISVLLYDKDMVNDEFIGRFHIPMEVRLKPNPCGQPMPV